MIIRMGFVVGIQWHKYPKIGSEIAGLGYFDDYQNKLYCENSMSIMLQFLKYIIGFLGVRCLIIKFKIQGFN